MSPAAVQAVIAGVQLVDTLIRAATEAGHGPQAAAAADQAWASMRARRERLAARMAAGGHPGLDPGD